MSTCLHKCAQCGTLACRACIHTFVYAAAHIYILVGVRFHRTPMCVFRVFSGAVARCRTPLSPGAGGRARGAERGIGRDTSIPGWEKGSENG